MRLSSLAAPCAIVSLLLLPAAGRAACVGDCAGDGTVAIEDLVLGVNVALGTQPASACAAADADGDGATTVDELLRAVRASLDGCPPEPTPTATPSLVDELAATGLGRYLGAITPVSSSTRGDWESHVFDADAEQAICLRGGQYQAAVRRGTSNKVLVYFEGGGACWNNQSCWETPTAKLTAEPFFGGGIFDFADPENPFRDWNIVYAPYCDGSVFGGDHVVDYPGGRAWHHGVQNASAAVTLARATFPDPDMVAVAGSSAGGYGTLTGYGLTRLAYPDAPMVVLNDSGPGLQNPGDPQGIADRRANWRYDQFVPASCRRCDEQLTYLTEWGLERDPTLRVGYFSALQDFVIRTFLLLPPADYEDLLRAVTGDLRSRQPDRYRRFFIQGASHTVLELPQFYTTEIDGLRVRDWTAALLDGGPAWQDVIEAVDPSAALDSPRDAGAARVARR